MREQSHAFKAWQVPLAKVNNRKSRTIDLSLGSCQGDPRFRRKKRFMGLAPGWASQPDTVRPTILMPETQKRLALMTGSAKCNCNCVITLATKTTRGTSQRIPVRKPHTPLSGTTPYICEGYLPDTRKALALRLVRV